MSTILTCNVCKNQFVCLPRGDEIPLMCPWCLMNLRLLVEEAS